MAAIRRRFRRWPAALLLLALLWPAAARPEEESFSDWLAGFWQEAAARGISEETLERSLGNLQPLPRVISSDRQQPEQTRTFSQYAGDVLSPARVNGARARLQQYRPLLEKIERRYGVPPRMLVSLWGIESFFGTWRGDLPVVAALATLAWEGRRGPFFRRELLSALEILDAGQLTAEEMVGSWAGAMGHFQFIPSTFQRFAVDYDGDGRRDIWNDLADAFASAANYLHLAGWQPGVGWGQRVQLPETFNSSLAGLDTRKTYRQWRRAGIRGIQGPADRRASLLLPEGPEGPAFLVTDNFRALLAWNRSTHFALAAGLLADEMLPQSAGRPAPAR